MEQTPLEAGVSVKEHVVRPIVGGTTDDNELEDSMWACMNRITVLEQAERFYTHTYSRMDDGTYRIYVCMFTDRLILEPAYSPNGRQFPLLHTPNGLDFTYNTGCVAATDADMSRFRKLTLNQQSPVLQPFVNNANEIDTAFYALGFRYRGIYGVYGPIDYAITFTPDANGGPTGSFSFRAVAVEVIDPNIQNSAGEAAWIANFRNLWYTETGILVDSIRLRYHLAVLLVDTYTPSTGGVTEAELFVRHREQAAS